MSSSFNRIKKNIIEAMQSTNNQGTSAYDSVAEVRRVEGDTAWVHIAGGVDETPVKLTIAAKAGDVVQVRVGGGRAWITGNASAPPTDDKTAIAAKGLANIAGNRANAAQTKANEAENAAATAQSKADSAGSAAENAANAAGAAGTAAKQAAVQADQAKTDAANVRNAANKVNVKFSSLIRKTDDGIECGMVPDASTLTDGNSVTVPVALVNTDGSFDVNLITYTNTSGTVSRTKSVRFASFGKEAVIGEIDQTHARIDTDSFDIVDAGGYLKASLGGSTPMIQIGKFTFVNRENGNLTLRLNGEG